PAAQHPPAAAPAANAAADAEARKKATVGAQVVLDPASDAAMAAKGGMAPDIIGNTDARDKALIAMGLDPVSPSAHLTDPKPAAH
ncbi:MAG TPA: hypothetical protein VGH84_13930, partial [Steroidobacteraceae bacterium]